MAKIKLQIDPMDKILLKRSLNKNGKGQQFFTHEVRRMSTPYRFTDYADALVALYASS